MKKAEVRKYMRRQLSSLSESDKEAAAVAVFEKLEEIDIFQKSKKILLYYSLPNELPTHAFLNRWSEEKELFLPRVVGDDLEIVCYDKKMLVEGSYNIMEPIGDALISPSEIELIILPAVAYDRSGNRLGHGKGYYDRLLTHTNAYTIGVGFDVQMIDNIPVEVHDKKLNMVITPQHTIYANI